MSSRQKGSVLRFKSVVFIFVQGALGRTIRVLVPWGPSSAKAAHSTAAPDGGGVRARCLPYYQHELLVLSVHTNPFHSLTHTHGVTVSRAESLTE